MADPLIDVAADLQRRGEPFVLATVVRCEAPTSAKPGAKALVHADGRVEGWVGGACAEPVLIREALKALRDGRPRLVGLYGEGGRQPGRTEGILDYAMTCHSGGTLEIYVEPYLPTPQLVLVGHGPVIEALADARPRRRLRARAAARRLGVGAARRRSTLDGRASVVVATHADSDEDALERVLRSEAGYVSLVASRKRTDVDPRTPEAARRAGRAPRPAEGAGRARPRRRHAGGDRGQHPGRDRPAPPGRQDGRGRGRAARPPRRRRRSIRSAACRSTSRGPAIAPTPGGARRTSAAPAARRRSSRTRGAT